MTAPVPLSGDEGPSSGGAVTGVPWPGDDPRWDAVDAAWRSHAYEECDEHGRLDVTEVDICVGIALHKAFAIAAHPHPVQDGMREKVADQGCRVPPEGWWCSREPGHEGPCAARPTGLRETIIAIVSAHVHVNDQQTVIDGPAVADAILAALPAVGGTK